VVPIDVEVKEVDDLSKLQTVDEISNGPTENTRDGKVTTKKITRNPLLLDAKIPNAAPGFRI